MKRLFKISLFVCLLIGSGCRVAGQNYPVQVNAQLLPPYTSYLSDFTEVGSQRFMANFVLKDLTLPEYRCKLRLTIEGVGITIRTKQNFIPRQPLVLPGGGIPLQVYGEDMVEYFNPDNLDFTGITKRQYAKSAKLPEGVYRFTIEVLDYNRGTLVSNKGTSTAWIILNDPPILNLPRSETKVRILDPTYIPFTWTPRHTGSPNAAFTTEYVFRLVEIWPANRNPYDAFLSQPALYEVTTSSTQIVYGMTEPALIPGRKYAWQVQAKDSEGRDLFKNQGKSEVFVFQFGDAMGKPENIKQDGNNATAVNLSWESPSQGEMPAQYRVRYRKRGSGDQGIWYEAVTTQRWITLPDLQSKTDYEVQVRSESKPQVSDYSTLKVMATSEAENLPYSCGNVTIPTIPDNKSRLLMLAPGEVINSRGFKFVVTEVKGSGGVFDGRGVVQVPFFNMANVRVAFAGVQLNNSRELVAGEIVTLYNPGSEIAQEIEDAHKIGEDKPKAEEQKTDSLSVVTKPDYVVEGTIDTVYSDPDGKIIVVDNEGKQTVLEQKKDEKTGEVKETVIADAGGNTYTVGKDGEVTKSPGTNGNSNTNTIVQADPIKDRIIVLILEQFEEEIAAWLRINGKGGEENEDVLIAEQLPEAFPKEAPFLEHLKDNVIPHFKEQAETIRADVEKESSNKTVFDRTSSLFKTKEDVDWSKVDQNDQESLRNAISSSLMSLPGEELAAGQFSDLVPDCGRKHAGKDKPLQSLFLIHYPEGCSASWNYYISEGIVTNYIAQGYGKYLCTQERFNLIKCLSTGTVLEPEEQAIIKLLTETPRTHTASLLSLFNADNTGLLKDINGSFQFSNYVTVFKAIQKLYLNGTAQAVIDAEVEKINNTFLSDKSREEKAQQNYFTWFEGGILKAVFADNFVFNRFDDISISDNGTVTFKYATDPKQHGETTTPVTIKPFALVGLRVRGNSNEVLEAGDGNVVYVPGITLPLLISKKETAEFYDALNATAVVTGVGSIVTGTTRFVIVSGGIDVLLGGSALVVDSYKDDIVKMQNGEAFLDAYVLVNKAFLIYFGSRTILQLTQALPKLATAFATFKNADDFAKLKATNPSKAVQIEKEVDDLIKESDQVLLSVKANSFLRKIQYGSDELSKMVQNFRKTTGKKTGNVAVIEYIDNSGMPKYQIGESTGIYNPHAEKAAWLQLETLGIKPEQVTRIYTELEPCASRGRYCKNFITRTFPNAKTYYSFDYLNGTTESCKASVKTLGEQINLLFE